jgi:hypothetical protein
MIWVRRVLAAPLLLVTFICVVGSVRMFAGKLPNATPGEGVMAALFAAVCGTAGYFLLRPDIQRLGGLSSAQFRKWLFTNPLGQAALLYAVATPIMAVAPKVALLPGFIAQCAYTVLSTRAAGAARRFWPTALLALLCFVLLMGALAATSEGLTKGGFGEAGMIFLLPMYGFPIFLAIFGIARWMRRSKAAGAPPADRSTSPD